MPEGPELLYLSIKLKNELKNAILENIVSNTKSIVKIPKKSKVLNVYSYGKNLIIDCKNYKLLVHLGITGWLVNTQPKIYKYIFEFNNQKIYLKDQRRFSKIVLFTSQEDLEDYLTKYGVDILTKDFTFDYFNNIIKSKKKLLCSILLDQKYFAGLGNYIKNDSLYLSKINPNKKTNDLDENEIKELYNNIKFIAYSNIFTWLKENNLKVPQNIQKLSPNKLNVPYTFKVYEQEYDAHGNKVIFIKNHCGRRTFYVPKLQK